MRPPGLTAPWRWPWLPSWQQAAHVFFGDLGTDFHSSSCLKERVTASPQGTSRKLRGQVGGGCGTSWALDSLCSIFTSLLGHVVPSSSTISLKTHNLQVALVGKGIHAWEAADGVTPSVHALSSCTRPQGAWMQGGMGLLESRTLPSAG